MKGQKLDLKQMKQGINMDMTDKKENMNDRIFFYGITTIFILWSILTKALVTKIIAISITIILIILGIIMEIEKKKAKKETEDD